MPEATKEIVYTGFGKFVQEKIIAPHTPEAHYQKIMQKYFWATDRLEGKPREIAQRIRPQVELAAKAAGWSETFAELYLAGSALALTTIIAGKGLKSAAEVFGRMGRNQGDPVPISPYSEAEGAPAVRVPSADSVPAPKTRNIDANPKLPAKKLPTPDTSLPYRRPPPGADVEGRDERLRRSKKRKKLRPITSVTSVVQPDEWEEKFGPVHDAVFGGAEQPEDYERNRKLLIDIIRELATSEHPVVDSLLKVAAGHS